MQRLHQKTRLQRFMIIIIFVMTMCLTTLFSGVMTTYASISPAQSYTNLLIKIRSGKYIMQTGDEKSYDFSRKQYKMDGGGFKLYTQMFDSDGTMTSFQSIIDTSALDSLTTGAKQDFVKDMLTIANAMVYDYENGYKEDAVSNDTVNTFCTELQGLSGMGSTLLASLMSNTKPDYATANKIYQPFSGIVNTILGVVSILVMSLLGITMALDIAFITIPAFQMMMGGVEGNDSNKGLAGIISQEAKSAVRTCENGGGSNGEYKAAIGQYFKFRWKGLVILVICLLYLVQGQIYSAIGWFIDLFSGFLGF